MSRVGVAEHVIEPEVSGEAAEELRCAYLLADPAPYARGVVEDDAPGHTADVAEHGEQPLADAFGGLAVKHLREAHVGEGEVADKIMEAGAHVAQVEVGLSEVHLHVGRYGHLVEEAL